MKVWVEIVAIDGRRIKTPVCEDYEDHRDDDPICTADVVAGGGLRVLGAGQLFRRA